MSDQGIQLSLRDGTSLVVRPIRADDKALLTEHFEHLGPESRYRRFFGPHNVLSERELHYFTEVDHLLHEALMAIDPATGAPVGVARYIASAARPDTAELAMAVTDEWQGRGVGSALAHALCDRARENGVRHVTATVLADNVPMLALLRELGDVRLVERDGGTQEFVLELPERGVGDLGPLIRAAASG